MNISDWIEFEITEQDVKLAREIERVRSNAEDKYEKTTRFDSINRGLIGAIGEIKFAQFIGQQPDLRELTGSDSFDFKINGRIVDVKTNENDRHPSRSPDNYRFLVNKSQVDSHKDVDYYVSAMIYKNKVWLCGFISRAEVLTYSTKNPGRALCYSIPYSDLHKPQELRKFLN